MQSGIKTNMSKNKDKSLTFKALMIATGKTIKRIMGTLLILVLVRIFTKEDFGTYRQILFIIGMVLVVIEFSIPKSLLFFVPKQKNEKDQKAFISQSYQMLSTLAIFTVLLMLVLSDLIAKKFNNPEIGRLLRIYSPVLIFQVISHNYFSSVMISLNRHKTAALSYVFIGMPNTLAILVSALLDFNLEKIFTISLIVVGIQYSILLVLIKKLKIGIFVLPNIEKIKEQLKYVLPLSLALLSGLISVELDRIVISMYFTAEIFAIYSIGAMQVPFVGNLFEGVSSTVIPKISEYIRDGKKEKILDLCNRGTRKVSILLFPIFAFLYVHANEIIVFLYTEQYAGAVKIFRIYLLVILMKISFCGNILMGTGKTKVILITTLFTLTLNLILNFILVKHLGLIGPAIATIGSRLLHQGIFVIFVCFFLKYSFHKIFPLVGLGKIMLLSFLSSVLVRFISILEMPKIFDLTAKGVLFLIVYLVGLYVFKMLLQSEKEMIRNFMIKLPLIKS